VLANLPRNVLMIDIKVEWLSVKVILALQSSLFDGKNDFIILIVRLSCEVAEIHIVKVSGIIDISLGLPWTVSDYSITS
jgi:hypothetical protein